ncbi:MAG: hypothetical protein LBJ41_02345 [Treponema sp.]|jgi:hypothetical protein|nr:hypothetical protein [Treponema sp.]
MFIAGSTNMIPGEYRKTASALFPSDGTYAKQVPGIEATVAFAEILGIGNDYRSILDTSTVEQMAHFLQHFQNNLDLLIQKTWVEKADKKRKEKLQKRIPLLIDEIKKESYQQALIDFGAILEELAYLFFGAQSNEADFTEYTFRIDIQMGLFWWYGGQIGRMRSIFTQVLDDTVLRAILLLGICYLTNF